MSKFQGLTTQQVNERKEKGLVNNQRGAATKTIGQIIATNLCTLFNLINAILAGLVLFTGSYKNALFMIVILCNLLIGIVQEIRAKRTIDKLSLISAPTATVIRDGQVVKCPVSEVVQDDICILQAGDQIYADMEILEGTCEVNESQVTGESEPVQKSVGDSLLSGGYLVAGTVTVRACQVGDQSYSVKLANSAKYIKKPNSEIMTSLKFIIKVVSIAIAPMGLLLFLNQVILQTTPRDEAIVRVVAALIGMIPEGMVLMSSVVLAVSVIRLARHNTLVQELYCIETLARVDVLCLDKTGTITEGRMKVEEILPVDKNHTVDEISDVLIHMTINMEDTSATFDAVRQYFTRTAPVDDWKVVCKIPFSSARKWSGISFEGVGSYVLGAAEFVYPQSVSQTEKYAQQGKRVLLLAHSREKFGDAVLPEGLHPVGFVVIGDVIRPEAYDTIKFFKNQGVTLKVISGDNPRTVASVAGEAGLLNSDRCIDVTGLSEEDLKVAATEYTVFGRVTPDQKLILIKALKDAGHTVAMTGDGVNDVPALKEADCSVAMASGSTAAREVSQLVLLDSNFASMPRIVAEGRRAINNIQRSASLFLVKTIFSFLLSLVFLVLPKPYPFQPIQLTLCSAICVGIPSVILALEPNRERVSGRFIDRLVQKALPGGLSVAAGVLMTVCLGPVFGMSPAEISTLSVMITAFNMFAVLFRTCLPFDKLRIALFCVLLGLFCTGFIFFDWFFGFAKPDFTMLIMFLCIAAGCVVLMLLTILVINKIIRKR